MKSLKIFTVKFVCLSFLLIPVGVSAQANSDAAYRALLIQLIENLQKQIIALQANLETRNNQTVEKTDTLFEIDEGAELVAVYKINQAALDLGVSNLSHRRYLNRLLEILPEEYDDKITQFMIFGGEEAMYDAFVETLPPDNYSWQYAVNQDYIGEEMSAANTELVIHELGHIVSYEEVLGVPRAAIYNCDSYFELRGCLPTNYYLSLFVKEFWSKKDLARAEYYFLQANPFEEVFDYYQLNSDEYVSDYAAYSPEEDFSEAFMWFVLDKKVVGGEEKVEFFARYPELVRLKKEIRTNLN